MSDPNLILPTDEDRARQAMASRAHADLVALLAPATESESRTVEALGIVGVRLLEDLAAMVRRGRNVARAEAMSEAEKEFSSRAATFAADNSNELGARALDQAASWCGAEARMAREAGSAVS